MNCNLPCPPKSKRHALQPERVEQMVRDAPDTEGRNGKFTGEGEEERRAAASAACAAVKVCSRCRRRQQCACNAVRRGRRQRGCVQNVPAAGSVKRAGRCVCAQCNVACQIGSAVVRRPPLRSSAARRQCKTFFSGA